LVLKKGMGKKTKKRGSQPPPIREFNPREVKRFWRRERLSVGNRSVNSETNGNKLKGRGEEKKNHVHKNKVSKEQNRGLK